jgi:hypothetical protein
MQTQKRFPISALAGFHVLSALANIAAADKVSLSEEYKEKSQQAGEITAPIEIASTT